MDKTPSADDIRLLTRCVEISVRREIKTPRDFTFLRECIFARVRTYLSESTLKRVWGYLPRTEARTHTLDVLSSFLGYTSWAEFVTRMAESDGACASSPVLGRHLCVGEDMKPGDRLLLVWQPGRRCAITYLGDGRFVVTESENTRLRPGDTFGCAFIIEGEPLYLDRLSQAGRQPVSYVCGKISGIRFQPLG